MLPHPYLPSNFVLANGLFVKVVEVQQAPEGQVLNEREMLGVGDVVTYVKVIVMHAATQRTLKETIGRRGAFAFRKGDQALPSRGFKTSYNNSLLQANSCWLPAQPGTIADVLRQKEIHTTHPLGANLMAHTLM